MPTKIRLQRQGKKGHPYYHIVIADSRAPRDGRYIERVGAYDPNQNPALIEVDREKTSDWLSKGAQPTDTVRAILSYKGVMYLNHLQRGVTKGALTQADADKKFDKWLKEKEEKIQAKRDQLSGDADAAEKARMDAEKKKAEDMAAAIATKQSELAAEAARATEEAAAAEAGETAEAEGEAPAEDAPVAETKAEEAPAEDAPVAEAKAEEAPAEDAPVAEAKAEEAPVEEAPVAEAKAEEAPAEEAPVAEAKAEEAPAEEAPVAEAKAEEEGKNEEKKA